MTTDTTSTNGWPPQPNPWPPVLDEVQAAQYLHLDYDGRTIESAKRTLRYLRRNAGLPSPGRIARKVLYRREAVDAWLASRECKDRQTAGISLPDRSPD